MQWAKKNENHWRRTSKEEEEATGSGKKSSSGFSSTSDADWRRSYSTARCSYFFFVVFLRRRVQLCEFCNYNKIQLVNKRLEHINRCYFTCQSEILFLLSLTKLSFRFNNYRWVRSNPHFKKSNKVNVMHWRVLINNKINGIPFLLFVNCFEHIYFKKKE